MTTTVKILEETAGFLSDASYNVRARWEGAEDIAADVILKHIEAAERLIEIEIRRIQ